MCRRMADCHARDVCCDECAPAYDRTNEEEAGLLHASALEAPHARRPTEWAVNVGVAVAYALASIVTTLANKALLSSWGFGLVFSLLMLQNLLTVFVVGALKLGGASRESGALKLDGAPREGGMRSELAHALEFPLWERGLAVAMAPVMLVCIANLVCGMSALRLSSVPVYQTLKRMTPLPAMALDCALRGKTFPTPVLASVLVVCAGAFITGCGDIDLNARGYMYALASCVLQALYLVLAARASDARPLSSLAAAYYNALLSLPLLIVGVWYEWPELLTFPFWSEARFITMLVLDLVLGASLSMLLFMCTLVNSALTTTIVGNAKAVATTALGALLFGRVGLRPLGWVGVCVNTAGGLLYSVAKYTERARAQPRASPRR